jgi:hypothetical protein
MKVKPNTMVLAVGGCVDLEHVHTYSGRGRNFNKPRETDCARSWILHLLAPRSRQEIITQSPVDYKRVVDEQYLELRCAERRDPRDRLSRASSELLDDLAQLGLGSGKELSTRVDIVWSAR